MAKGWMSKDPSEMTARQQRRMQFLEKRGRVQGQPTEMPEMTARQQRRQQFLERKKARQDRRVEDWRAQQQAANVGNAVGQLPADLGGGFGGRMADFANKPGSQGENPFGDYRQLTDQELYERGYDPRDFNSVSTGPDGREITTLMGFDNSPLDSGEKERLWQERLRNPRPQFNSGFEYNRALQQNPGSLGITAGRFANGFQNPYQQMPTPNMNTALTPMSQRQNKPWWAN